MTRASIYHALSELLAGSPPWAVDSARAWSLYADAERAAHDSPAARRAILSLSDIPLESAEQRQARYDALFLHPPRRWLYESAAKTGRILGEETFAVAKIYRAAGLVASLGAEPPDHASLELAFLAHLAENADSDPEHADAWRALERQFIREHGDWLIQLGRGLAKTGDMVYAPVGQLLADWLAEASQEAPRASHASDLDLKPVVPTPDDCTLCGFCVQVCPVHALAIRETESETALLLNVPLCVGCRKCEKICDTKAISLSANVPSAGPQFPIATLRLSSRAICPSCHKPTVSRAELEYIGAQIGHPAWLDYCLDCRPKLYGG